MINHSNSKKKNILGFTLVEFLIVAAVIGIMTSSVFAYVSNSKVKTKDTNISLSVAQIESIAEIIYLNDGSYDSLCQSATSLSSERGLDVIQAEIEKNGGEVSCFAEGDNYCISAQLNGGEFFFIKDNRKAQIGTEACLSSTVGGGEDDDTSDDDDDNNDDFLPVEDLSCYSDEDVSVSKIIGGGLHSLALLNDGTIYSWGINVNGQLGDNTKVNKLIPTKVVGASGEGYLANVSDVEGGLESSIALKTNGTVYFWGKKSSSIDVLLPTQMRGVNGVGFLTNIKSIAAGDYHFLALREDGAVYSWGGNTFGELGDGTKVGKFDPVQVKGVDGVGYLTSIEKVSAGAGHSVALKEDGTVYAWGDSQYGQLGAGIDVFNGVNPVQVKGVGGDGYLTDIKDISSGNHYSIALKEDGTVWAWGMNDYGQLGNDSTENSFYPVQVKGVGGDGYLTDITEVFAGGNPHSLALKSDGTVYAWGFNTSGQLGNNSTTNSSVPVQVKDQSGEGYITEVESIKGGTIHSFAIKEDGTVWAWGNNSFGQLGDGSTVNKSLPIRVWNLSAGVITDIAAGGSHNLIIKGGSSLWSWGYNSSGQLGDNTTTERLRAIQVRNSTGDDFIENVGGISAGAYHSLAFLSDGTLYSWGYNGAGQLGNDSTIDSSVPVKVLGVGGGYLSNIINIAAGDFHSLAVNSSGNVYSWGNNQYGQLGDNSTTTRSTPIQVNISNVSLVSAGDYHSLALKTDGTVWAWGRNYNGQLGNNTIIDSLTPVQVKGVGGVGNLSNVIDISAGTWFSMALKSDGTVYAWGYNNYGQLGNDGSSDSSTPIQVLDETGEGTLSGIIKIASRGAHSLALKSDGTVYAWGRNNYGQLGDRTNTTRRLPIKVKDSTGDSYLENISSIAVGREGYSLALSEDGIVFGWGKNAYGELGNNTIINTALPARSCDIPLISEIEEEEPEIILGCMDEDAINYQPFADTDDGSCQYACSSFIEVSAGLSHSIGYKEDGTAWAWGIGSIVGDGTALHRYTPVQIKGADAIENLTEIKDVSSGENYSLALKEDGTVWAWGNNNGGQLGNGNSNFRYTPTQVLGVSGNGYLTDIISVSAGVEHSLALKSDGTVWAWGNNAYGQLGNDSTLASLTPVQVKGVNGFGYLTDIIAISAGNIHSLALKSDGTVFAWGQESLLGIGTWQDMKKTPVQVLKGESEEGGNYLTDIIAISTGNTHSLALKEDGTTYTWGANTYGQLGTGDSSYKYSPIKVKGVNGIDYLTNVIDVSGGKDYSLILKSNGTVFAWGYNGYGQLGDGTIINKNTPVQVRGQGGIGYLTGIANISSYGHSKAISSDGIVYSWGRNNYGQLGDGTTNNSNVPVKVIDCMLEFAPSIIQVSASNRGFHSLALKSDGTVWSWGKNNIGQIGDGTQLNRLIPFQVKHPSGEGNLTNITEVSAGEYHSLGLAVGGTVYSWGWNYYGQLGDNTTTSKLVPIQVKGVGGAGYLTGVNKISAGARYSMVLKDDGTVFAWGRNNYGQLGDGASIDKLTPIQVRGLLGSGYLTNIINISAGGLHSLALKSDGTVFSWGNNDFGQLGINSTTTSFVPKEVQGLTNVVSISAGYVHSLALKSDGTVWAWGRNYNGQLGNNTTLDSLTPVQVKGVGGIDNIEDVKEIVGGEYHSLALKEDGTVYSWGYNNVGQLGNETIVSTTTPIKVKGYEGVDYLTNVRSISAGGSHNLALKFDGTLWSWGNNLSGQLGDNTVTNKTTPVLVLWDVIANNDPSQEPEPDPDPEPVFGCMDDTALNYNILADTDDGSCEYNPNPFIKIAAGGEANSNNHSIGLLEDGTVWAWGSNNSGQLGDGTLINRNVPVQVKGVNGIGYLTGIIDISAGNSHSLALKSDGTVYTWGSNSLGQLGIGNNSIRKNSPVQVKGVGGSGYLTNVESISAGSYHSMVIISDGTTYSWGYNAYGQLGDNTTTNRNTPVQIKGVGGSGYLTDIITISGGGLHSLALKEDGTVYSWGYNNKAQLGDDSINNKYTPVQVKGISGIGYLTDTVDISAGNLHSLALKEDGTVYSWGDNTYGQLGDTTTINRYTPIQVKGPNGYNYLNNIVSISIGSGNSLALKNDGTVWAWGWNAAGKLGDGTYINRYSPTQVRGTGASGYLTRIKDISTGVGSHHSLALRKDGYIYSWGWNYFGQLGDGTNTNRYFPVKVRDPENNIQISFVIDISGGYYDSSLALKSDGTVFSWGDNGYGQLGTGSTIDEYIPVQVMGSYGFDYLDDVISISTGAHSLALKSDGTVWAWGLNTYGNIGDGTTRPRLTYVQVKGVDGVGYLTNVKEVSVGSGFSLALKNDGTVWSWGLNNSGQLGDGTTTNRYTPIQVKGLNGVGYLTDVKDISAGHHSPLALKNDGTVWAWGYNSNGQLGDGTTTNRYTPIQVKGLNGVGYLTNVKEISAGPGHSLALKNDGTVWAWGWNYYRQLGDGTTTSRYTPVQVKGVNGVGYLVDIKEIFTKGLHSLALKTDGTVWAWGWNNYGQLGNGTITSSYTPVQVKGVDGVGYLTDIEGISAGSTHSLALKSNGSVYSWGYNISGQLGDGTTLDKNTPIKIQSLD